MPRHTHIPTAIRAMAIILAIIGFVWWAFHMWDAALHDESGLGAGMLALVGFPAALVPVITAIMTAMQRRSAWILHMLLGVALTLISINVVENYRVGWALLAAGIWYLVAGLVIRRQRT